MESKLLAFRPSKSPECSRQTSASSINDRASYSASPEDYAKQAKSLVLQETQANLIGDVQRLNEQCRTLLNVMSVKDEQIRSLQETLDEQRQSIKLQQLAIDELKASNPKTSTAPLALTTLPSRGAAGGNMQEMEAHLRSIGKYLVEHREDAKTMSTAIFDLDKQAESLREHVDNEMQSLREHFIDKLEEKSDPMPEQSAPPSSEGPAAFFGFVDDVERLKDRMKTIFERVNVLEVKEEVTSAQISEMADQKEASALSNANGIEPYREVPAELTRELQERMDLCEQQITIFVHRFRAQDDIDDLGSKDHLYHAFRDLGDALAHTPGMRFAELGYELLFTLKQRVLRQLILLPMMKKALEQATTADLGD